MAIAIRNRYLAHREHVRPVQAFFSPAFYKIRKQTKSSALQSTEHSKLSSPKETERKEEKFRVSLTILHLFLLHLN